MIANPTVVSTVYTFAMAKLVSVQVRGVEKAIQIDSDKVERQSIYDGTGAPIFGSYKLVLSKNGTPVGEFNSSIVDGWWYQE